MHQEDVLWIERTLSEMVSIGFQRSGLTSGVPLLEVTTQITTRSLLTRDPGAQIAALAAE